MTPNNLISAFLPSGLTVLPELLVRDCGHTSPCLLPFGIANEPKGLTPFYLERTDRITLGIRFPNHKTYASVLLSNQVDEKLIMSQMGHTDIATTRNIYYFNRNSEDERKKIISKAINF